MTPRRAPEPTGQEKFNQLWTIVKIVCIPTIAFFLFDFHSDQKQLRDKVEQIMIDISSLKTDVGNVKDNVKNLIITSNQKEMRDQRERDAETLKDNGK